MNNHNAIKAINSLFLIITIVLLFTNLLYSSRVFKSNLTTGFYGTPQAILTGTIETVGDKLAENLIPKQYRKAVVSICKKESVSITLVYKLVKAESGWRNNAYNVNSSGSVDRGLFQLNSRFIDWFGNKFAGHKVNPYNPYHSIKTGVRYIAWLKKQFNGNIEKTLMAYNWGIGNVKSGRAVPECVRKYVDKIVY